ncbi:hypothetical protein BZA77DRAFT_384008 [Pyronema omphalodes]|nr:hypothetical protein BZA77DRAFT_384008 [Pyronema omphalodes]
MNSDFSQTLPPNPDLAHQAAFHSHFSPFWTDVMKHSAVPYPIMMSSNRTKELQDLHTALHTALTAIVRRWWSRPDFSDVIPVSEKLSRVLKELDRVRPYEMIGSFRPDFLIRDGDSKSSNGMKTNGVNDNELDGSLTICEINARFMFNGFILAMEMDQARERSGLTTEGEKEGLHHSTCGKFTDLVQAYANLIDASRPVAIVGDKELRDPHDVAPAADMLFPFSRFVKPQSLRLSSDGMGITDDIGPLDQFLLEMHQFEIEELSEPLLHVLAKTCWNDLRTIYFVHDKRMLYLIRRELEWLVGLGEITPGQAEVLRRGVTESYIPKDPQFERILHEGKKDEWTLKMCMAGKGEGMIFGKNVDEDRWKEVLESQRQQESGCSYVLQRYIKQKRVPLMVPMPSSSPDGEASLTKVCWPLVGTFLCVDRHFLGISPWRTAPADIIALSHGLGFAFPSITEVSVPSVNIIKAPQANPQNGVNGVNGVENSNSKPNVSVPADARVFAALNGPEVQYDQVRASLAKYGLSVVHLPRQDPDSKYVVALSQALGLPLAHSSAHGILWDVRPIEGMDSKRAARSETKECFPWHTDCSFELAPPRYFALHILHPDLCGGGQLRLLSVPHLLERLPAEIIATLQTPQFKFRVPREFMKDKDHVVGSILMPLPLGPGEGTPVWKMRYRREIIDPMNEEAKNALDVLEKVLAEINEGKTPGVNVLGPDVMTENAVIVVDNARFLHARSEINDPRRWLRRVRWAPEHFD